MYRRRQTQAKINFLALMRFFVFMGLVISLSLLVFNDYPLYSAAGTLVSLVIFMFLMVRHDRCYRFSRQCETAEALTSEDLARVQYRFGDLQPEQPMRFPAEHPFAADLDFDGPHSLLKLLDNSYHQRARAFLARWMDHIDPVETIRNRQQAVAMLGRKHRFRLKLSLSARLGSQADLAPEVLRTWLKMAKPATLSKGLYLFGRISALAACILLFMRFFLNIEQVPWLAVIIFQTLVFYAMDRVHYRYMNSFMRYGKAIKAAAEMVEQFEKLQLNDGYLHELKKRLEWQQTPAAPKLAQLIQLEDRLRYRENAVAHFAMNILFLWDQHQLLQLHRWREKHGAQLESWFQVIFEVEALSALANFHALFPDYPFPELTPVDAIHINAQAMAHPTIPAEKRIGNDYRMEGNGRLHLVTGSNMSGKSTFLRTIGSNLILARMGAPVCAQAMTCSLPRLWTSIRIQDSLEEGVSYFYAEVRRLKAVLDAIETSGPPVFYLLDEILKGTNSRERLIATAALVRRLVHARAGGLITTHDLEMLALTEEHHELMTNYHFQEGIRQDELYFDYKLKPGSLTSTNALRLMKLAGVPLEYDAAPPGASS